MKILCVADQVDPIVYSTQLKQRFGDVDLILSAGDLPLEYLSFIVSCLNKPLLYVFGNHNLKGLDLISNPRALAEARMDPAGACYSEADNGATHIGFRSFGEGGLIFVGLGGSMRYNGGENQYTDFQMRLQILRLVPRLLLNRILYGRYLDVLVTHAPPRGIGDKDDPCHRGFPCFLWFMRTFRPRWLVHGHIHLYDLNALRRHEYGGTTIVNAYSHYLIDTEEEG
jgi:uncharacterized protein